MCISYKYNQIDICCTKETFHPRRCAQWDLGKERFQSKLVLDRVLEDPMHYFLKEINCHIRYILTN
jgi:hypothetical protein